MKNVMLICISLFIGTFAFAQDKNAKAAFQVDGVCGMCKERIEKAAIRTKGVKSATWDVHTHYLSVIYDERKAKLEDIHQSVADVGHDTKMVTATEEAYNSVHDCCRYRDDEIKKDHERNKEDQDDDGS
ncbi:heavy-metal-associated domain-containing protein [Flavobacteriaceae bacterium TK19130]|nr:heavy-metal-associated domain-containing protein [Thermobacterium salinum]